MVMGVVLLVAGCSRAPEAPPAKVADFSDQMALGKKIYARTCALCHREGEGSAIAPRLRGSAVLEQPPAALAQVIILGRSRVTVVDGKKFDGTMPAQAYLTNEEIAAVVVYVRETLAGRRDDFSPYDAAQAREK